MNVTVARFALGVIALALICGPHLVAAIALQRRYLPDWHGARAWLANAVIALGLLVGVMEILGAARLFRLGPLVGGSLLLSGAVWFVRRRAGPPPELGKPGPGTGGSKRDKRPDAATAVGLIAAAAVIAQWAVPTLESYDVGIHTFDSLWYHLPWAASFVQSGQVTSLRFTDVEYLTQFYPATAELFHALGITTLGRDTISPVLNLGWLVLLLLSAYCIGRAQESGGASLAGAAVVMATPAMRFSQPGSAANDVVGMFFLLASAALLVNARGRRAALAVGGLAAGLAVAVKLSMVAAALALTAGAIVATPAGQRRRTASAWLGPMLAAGLFWYARNLITVGNPLPWVRLPGLAHPASPLQDSTGFSVAHYLTNGHVLSHFFDPGLASGLSGWWAIVLAAAVIGALLCLLLTDSPTPIRAVGAASLVAVIAYVLTPESAAGPRGNPLGFAFNLRYLAPGLALCLSVAPLAPILRGRRRWAPLAIYAALLVAMLTRPHLWPSAHVALAVLIGVLALALGLLVLLRAPLPRPRFVGALLLSAGLLLVSGGGYALQRHYLRGRYAYRPGVSSLAHVWALFRHIHRSRVGIVGTFGGFFSYPLAGVDDTNRVQYIAARGPHGSFTPIRTCQQWRVAVNAARPDYLVTTPARDPWHPDVLFESPEGAWTSSDPAARLRYRQRAAGTTIRVFTLHGEMNPRGCG